MANYRLWPSTDGAPTDEGTDPINLGTEITLSSTGWVLALHMWRATLSEVGPVTGAIYNVATATQVAGTAVTFTLSGTGWHTATLAAPVQLSAATRYIIVIRHTDRYAGTGGYWASGPGASGITNGIITAPPNSAVTVPPVGQGRFDEAGAIAAPTTTFGGGCYWCDATITDVNPGGVTGTATLTASGALATTGTKRGAGTATVSGALAAATTGNRRATGGATTTAAATLATAGRKTPASGISLGGSGALTTSGTKRGQGQAAVTGSSQATATGGSTRIGTATLTAASSATTTGTAHHHGTAALTATAALTGGQAGIAPTAHRIEVGVPHTRWDAGPATT